MMMMNRLAPLSEEPINEDPTEKKKLGNGKWRGWLKNQLSLLMNLNKKSEDYNLKMLLSVLGCPLFPVPVFPKLPLSHVSSSAEYIIRHFTAATGCRKLIEPPTANKTMYAAGKLTMSMRDDPDSAAAALHKGCFIMWRMVPDNWLIELVVAGHKVVAGCNGGLAWRRTPWLGPHAAPGGVRPLRRTLQGLDPVAVAAVFSLAQYMGEKQILDVDCFVLKLSAEDADLANRSDNTAEMIKHVTFGYFSQRSGLLVFLEDSYLTRIQCPGAHPMYWETTMTTKIEDYRAVEGVMIAHSGQSNVIILRFGDNLKAGTEITRMEEMWTIDDLAFNVPGLSLDCFIPPEEVKKGNPEEKLSWGSPLHR